MSDFDSALKNNTDPSGQEDGRILLLIQFYLSFAKPLLEMLRFESLEEGLDGEQLRYTLSIPLPVECGHW